MTSISQNVSCFRSSELKKVDLILSDSNSTTGEIINLVNQIIKLKK